MGSNVPYCSLSEICYQKLHWRILLAGIKPYKWLRFPKRVFFTLEQIELLILTSSFLRIKLLATIAHDVSRERAGAAAWVTSSRGTISTIRTRPSTTTINWGPQALETVRQVITLDLKWLPLLSIFYQVHQQHRPAFEFSSFLKSMLHLNFE